MESRAGRRWIINAFVYFLPVLFLWILATLLVGASLNAKINFLGNIRTSLLADYGPDYFNQSFKSLKLAIFGEVITDSVVPADTISRLEFALQGPVPTATGLQGVFESTSTPVMSFTAEIPPTETNIPTSSPTSIPEKTQEPTLTPTEKATLPVHTATPERESVIPCLECISENEDGSYTAYFGYKNPNSYQVEIPIGERNGFTPGSIDRGQPTIFLPGSSPTYPSSSFQVIFNGDRLTWNLDGNLVQASSKDRRCDPIVPQDIDTEVPQISEGDPDPPPGDLEICSLTITVDNLKVVDPAPSSGIAWVKLKYNVEGYTSDYIYSNPLTICSGGPTEGGGWEGCYSGAIVIEIDPTWASPEPEPFRINLYAKAQDNDGNDTCYFLGQYTMPSSCGASE